MAEGPKIAQVALLSVASADLVWLFAQRTLLLTPQAQSSFRVRPCATCCDTLESQGSTALDAHACMPYG